MCKIRLGEITSSQVVSGWDKYGKLRGLFARVSFVRYFVIRAPRSSSEEEQKLSADLHCGHHKKAS